MSRTMSENFYKELSGHEDEAVREAAKVCMEREGKDWWVSRAMRRDLSNLALALHEYLIKQREELRSKRR